MELLTLGVLFLVVTCLCRGAQEAEASVLITRRSSKPTTRRSSKPTSAPALSNRSSSDPIDPLYPGTAVKRMHSIRSAVRAMNASQLNVDWSVVRVNILKAGGLRDLTAASPGDGYTGHCFNDFNHVDLAAMRDSEFFASNKGRVRGIEYTNPLGPGVKIASIPAPGPGGSWCTCMIGCASTPPQDVCHIQFKSRVSFKLVWAPPAYKTFVLVDDAGLLLNQGTPTGKLPGLGMRQDNFQVVQGSKYATAALKVGGGVTAE